MDELETHDGEQHRVRDFYDRHPYPPPVDDLDGYRRRWQDAGRRRADFHLHWPDRAYRTNLKVLAAGCGTSQAARHAVRQPESHRLPPGATAALINCSHTDPDLVLIVNAAELRFVEAIDGKRSLAAILQQRSGAEANGSSLRDQARSLFERLWWYDQLVFDASRQAGENAALAKDVSREHRRKPQ